VQAYPGPEGLSVYFRDVSDRRRQDDELKNSRKRLAAATEAAGLGIHDYDPVSGRINWDARVRELWGIGPDEPVTYSTFFSGVHPEDRARVQTAVDAALDPGGDGKFFSEYRVISRSDGVERWIAATGRVTFEGNRAVRLVGTVQDVTARKLAREDFEATQNLLRSVSETVTDTVYVKDTKSRILFANPATLSVIGKPEDQVLGKTDRELYDDPEIGEAILATDRRIMESGVAEVIEETIQTPQGYRTFLSTKAPRRDASGRIIGLVGVSRDITERKQAESELRERERLLAVSQAVAHVGNWQWDSVHDRVTWSDELYRIYGVDRASFQADVSAVNALIHPDDLALQQEAIRNLLAGRQVEAFEYRIQRPDGTKRVVRVLDVQPKFDVRGNVAGMFGVVIDVTESRLAETALRESEQRFRSYFELGLIGMFITSPTKGFLEINHEICRILGYNRDELVTKTWAELTYPEDLPADAGQFERMLAGDLDAYTLEKRFIRKDGQVVSTVISVRAMRRPDGSLDHVVGLMQDITDRKKAEETQRKSETRLRAIISTLPVGLAVMDAAGRAVVTNKALDRIWGGSESAPEFPSDIPDTGRFKAWWATTGIPVTAADWASSRALLKGETSVGEVIDIQRFDGTQGTILNNATPLRDVNGNVDGAVVAVMDITELTQAQKALKEADRRKDEFLAMLAHELRNPLAAISSASQLLQQVGSQDPMVRRAWDAAARQTAHMARLLDDLLDIARVTQRKVTLNKTDVSLLSGWVDNFSSNAPVAS
jgi:PAS domain S-box-containing protein